MAHQILFFGHGFFVHGVWKDSSGTKNRLKYPLKKDTTLTLKPRVARNQEQLTILGCTRSLVTCNIIISLYVLLYYTGSYIY